MKWMQWRQRKTAKRQFKSASGGGCSYSPKVQKKREEKERKKKEKECEFQRTKKTKRNLGWNIADQKVENSAKLLWKRCT